MTSSSGLCKSTISPLLLLLTIMWLPQFGSAHRPRRLQQQQQQQRQFQRIITEESEVYTDLQPTSCIETSNELLNAIPDFYNLRESSEYDSSAAQTYGWPIESWCVSADVEHKLKSGDEAPLIQHIVTVFEHVDDTHDDDSLSLPDPNIIITHWVLSASGTPCVDVCSDANGTTSFPNSKTLPSAGEETMAKQNIDEDQVLLEGNASESYSTAPNSIKNLETTNSTLHSSGSRKKTTTAMLTRLIPVKLVCILSLMCLFLGVRQMFLSVERENGACCCKLGIFGFITGGVVSYEGIDPSDVGDHQKVVEFELLQLAASGELDADLDGETDIEIS
eukprot:CAMPEP_0197177378 /NCGR_PEP_ID=MMETSP1423-20130617/3001_1 /TAXON_ID=476441 /ORGANISM="Pseudo-nitzschia heimii, Strain UNC1101" /LENGTH=333 /DNA_ID=CAMNT_0042626915 /DNA_START=191 /DNA_END=1192 /DNA_ORIENTATION=+